MKKELWLIFLIVLIGLLGFGIVIPILPFIAQRFGANPTQIGLLIASYSIFQFIGSPILGRLSDKYGRKPVLSFSLLGSAIGFYLISFAHSLPLIFLSRIIDGLTGGNISVAQAYIADVTKGKERTKAMGLIGAAFGLGFVFGPVLGGVLSTYGFAVPFIFAGTLALLNSILILLILPESKKPDVIKKTAVFFSLKSAKEILQPKIVAQLTLLFFIVTFSFSLMQGIFPLFTEKLFLWKEIENGYFFAFIGAISVISQGFIIRKLVDIVKEKTLIKISIIILSLCFLGFGISNSVGQIYFIGGFLALSFGIFNTLIQSSISNSSHPEKQGIVLGFVQGLNALARALGPAIGGFLFGNFFIRSPFFFSSIILFLSIGLVFKIYSSSTKKITKITS